MRKTVVLSPIISKLIKLGVCHNIEDLVTSYQLKTCLFWFLKDELRFKNTLEKVLAIFNFQQNYDEKDFVDWAIAIYTTMRWFITKGKNREIPFFFLEHKVFIDKTPFLKTLFSCGKEWSDVELICCRKQKAILLVIDQILCVLTKRAKSTTIVEQHIAESACTSEMDSLHRSRYKLLLKYPNKH